MYDLHLRILMNSKLTSKYQATIPKKIGDALRLKAGDSITFQVLKNGTVIIKKSKSFDKEYLEILNNTLNEWASKYDEEDYQHLQHI
jgi:antitoxin PrlF